MAGPAVRVSARTPGSVALGYECEGEGTLSVSTSIAEDERRPPSELVSRLWLPEPVGVVLKLPESLE